MYILRMSSSTARTNTALWGSDELVTYEEIISAQSALKLYPDVLRTPTLRSWPVADARMSLKLESLQTTGSFKIRGMRYKAHTADLNRLQACGVVTLSAGNAGKAVSYLSKDMGIDAKVFMPSTAPDDRKVMMESLGAAVVKVGNNFLSWWQYVTTLMLCRFLEKTC